MSETFNQQVMRVLKGMVRDGEVVTKKACNGETLYALAPVVKHKPMKRTTAYKYCAKTRKNAAVKAWETRKKNARALRLSNAAKKAWVTRRAQNSALLHP
jgi:hypothetical protein